MVGSGTVSQFDEHGKHKVGSRVGLSSELNVNDNGEMLAPM